MSGDYGAREGRIRQRMSKDQGGQDNTKNALRLGGREINISLRMSRDLGRG